MTEEYKDERFCKHCNEETLHKCKDDGHERDSSWDYQECLTCGWYALGIDGMKYHSPIQGS